MANRWTRMDTITFSLRILSRPRRRRGLDEMRDSTVATLTNNSGYRTATFAEFALSPLISPESSAPSLICSSGSDTMRVWFPASPLSGIGSPPASPQASPRSSAWIFLDVATSSPDDPTPQLYSCSYTPAATEAPRLAPLSVPLPFGERSASPSAPPRNPKATFSAILCTLCDVNLNGQDQYEYHCTCYKHKKNTARLKHEQALLAAGGSASSSSAAASPSAFAAGGSASSSSAAASPSALLKESFIPLRHGQITRPGAPPLLEDLYPLAFNTDAASPGCNSASASAVASPSELPPSPPASPRRSFCRAGTADHIWSRWVRVVCGAIERPPSLYRIDRPHLVERWSRFSYRIVVRQRKLNCLAHFMRRRRSSR